MIGGMKGSDILRLVDAMHRDKGVDKEVIFMGIEAALLSAAKKKLGMEKNIVIEINRESGDITALDGENPISDYKSALQELTQGSSAGTPTYRVIAETGPDHEKEFRVVVSVDGRDLACECVRARARASPRRRLRRELY